MEFFLTLFDGWGIWEKFEVGFCGFQTSCTIFWVKKKKNWGKVREEREFLYCFKLYELF